MFTPPSIPGGIGQFAIAQEDKPKISTGSNSGFVVLEEAGKEPFKGELNINPSDSSLQSEFKPYLDPQTRKNSLQAILYAAGYPDLKILGRFEQTPTSSELSKFIPEDINSMNKLPPGLSQGTVVFLTAGNNPITIEMTPSSGKDASTKNTIDMKQIDSHSAIECTFFSSALANSVLRGLCNHPIISGGPYVFRPLSTELYTRLPKGPSPGGLILGGGQSVTLEGVINTPPLVGSRDYATFQAKTKPSQQCKSITFNILRVTFKHFL
jgi:hypothetical protein